MRYLKCLLIGLFIFSTVGTVWSAEKGKISVGPYFSYNTVSMDKVNNELEKLEMELVSSFPLGGIAGITKVKDGVGLEVEGLYALKPNLSLGLRIGYLSLPDASLSYVSNPLFPGGPSVKVKVDWESSLMPVMVGGKYRYKAGDKLTLEGNVFAGLGFAKTTQKGDFFYIKDVVVDPVTSELTWTEVTQKGDVPYSGSSLCLSLGAGLEYALSEKVSLGAQLGYNLAKVSKVKATEDVPLFEVKKGDTLKDSESKDLPLDFSGISLKVSLKFLF